jgi:HSP20 family protein
MKTLAKRNPSIFSTFPSIFDDFFTNEMVQANQRSHASFVPAVNVFETDEQYSLEVFVPGFSKENIKIDIQDEVLTISSETSEAKQSTEEGKFTRKEFSFSSFKRSFSIPEIVDVEAIDAKYENGILNILLPKRKEVLTQKVRTISIQL